MPAVGLARESSAVAEKELAYDFQVERLTDYGCRWIYGDRVSGTKDDRRGLEQALEKIKSGEADELVVTHFTRLARSVVTAHRVIQLLKKHQARLTVLDSPVDTSTPEGRFAFQLRAGLAELEAELGAERQKIGWQNSRRLGRPRAPVFGYLVQDGGYVPDEKNWDLAGEIIERFFELQSLNAVVAWLHQKHSGLKAAPRQQRPPYTGRGLKLWLLNPTLIGNVVFKGVVHQAQHLPLMERGRQSEIMQIISSRVCGVVRTQERRSAYSGLVFCACCGARAAKILTAKDSGEGCYTYFRCSNARTGLCENRRRVREEVIQAAVIEAIAGYADEIKRWLETPEQSVEQQEQENPKIVALRAQIDWQLSAPNVDDRILAYVADLEREIANLINPVNAVPMLDLKEALAVLESLQTVDFWNRFEPKAKHDRLKLCFKQILIEGSAVAAIQLQPWLERS